MKMKSPFFPQLILGTLLLSAVCLQADTAPDSISGYTVTARDSGDSITKTLVINVDRYTEFNDGLLKRAGPYVYSKLSATTGKSAFLRDDSSGDSDIVSFVFTTATNGTYSNVRLRLGVPSIRTGSFTVSTAQPQLEYFLIATNSVSMSFACDGINYLVGLETPGPLPTISAQMISPNGSKVGALIETGRTGRSAVVAFDGANYLMIWEDDGLGSLNGTSGWQVYGQFITKMGTAVGVPFNISGPGISIDGIKTMAFGGGEYLVTYTRLITPANGARSDNRYIAGRIVNPDGTVGREFRVSIGFAAASEVAFDGAHFFVVWCEDGADREIRGRFVSPAGLTGTEISVNRSPAPSDNPKSVAFDGTNYLVVWNDEVGGAGTGEWDSVGQLISADGSLVGETITIVSEPGPQMVTSVASDGGAYFAVWIEMRDSTNWDIYGQRIERSGSVVGKRLTLSGDTGNQMGGVGFDNGRYLLLVNNGILLSRDGKVIHADSSTGLFVTPSPKVQITSDDTRFGLQTNRFGFSIVGSIGQVIVVEAATTVTNSTWYPLRTNTLTSELSYFSDPEWTNFLSRFYRVRLP